MANEKLLCEIMWSGPEQYTKTVFIHTKGGGNRIEEFSCGMSVCSFIKNSVC